MDPFVSQLAEWCRANRTGVKWVFVPTHALGHTLGERLVLEGTDWANLRFTTPFDVALQMAAPHLVERGLDPASEGIGPALLMRLLLDLPSSVPGYFRPLANQPKMAEALWATLSELRLAGVRAAELPTAAFESSAKHTELQALLGAYERHLADRRITDRAAVCIEALAHLDAGPVLPADERTELPGHLWAPLERRLLDALPGRRLAPRALAVPGLDSSRRATLLAAPVDPTHPGTASDSERLAYLLRPDGAPQPRQDGTVAMFRAGGREAEIEEVLRRILEAQLPLDHVEIACASPAYTALLWEKAWRYEWPLTVAGGIPVTYTRPARALLAFCDWVGAGFPAGRLRRLLQSGDVRLELDGGPSPGQAARLLSRSEATWGRDTYRVALARLAASLRESAENPERDDETRARHAERAVQAERLAGWIVGVLERVPSGAADRPSPLGVWIDAARVVLGSIAGRSNQLDGAAAVALDDALAELAAVAELELAPREALGLIRACVEGLRVGSDRAREGHLHVAPLVEAGRAGRPHTFVVGLEEGGVLPSLLEDPVLLDRERERISASLAMSPDRVEEALGRVVSRLAALGGRVCLSFSCCDLREHRETFPSWILLQALRVQRPDEDWTYEGLAEALGEPVSPVPARPAQALDAAGWWLASLNAAGEAGRAAVLSAFPWLARGEAAETARESELYTAYDGYVPAAGSLLDPRVSSRAMSPTSLEDLAQCPFRYFLRRGLGLESIEDVEPDPDRWLDPLTRGSLLHRLYATILRELRQAGERPDLARHGERLRQLGDEELARHRALVPPPSEEVFAHERQALFGDLEVFLREETRVTDRVPVGLEVGFGAGSGEGEPIARPDPVEIDLGDGLRFRLRGRIDRIDRLSDGTYEVVDYKTGSLWLPGGVDAEFAGGRQLQHALYALAATQLLRAREAGARVSASSYYFPTVRGRAERVRRGGEGQERVGPVLRDLFALLAAGAFVHTRDENDCRFCEYARACGPRPSERAAIKVDHEANSVLAPFRRLGEHA